MRASRAAVLAGLGFVVVALLGAALNFGHAALIFGRSLPYETWGHPGRYAGYGSVWALGAAVITAWLLFITSRHRHPWREALAILRKMSATALMPSAVVYLLRVLVAIGEMNAAELIVAAMWFFVPAAIILGWLVTATVLKRHAAGEARLRPV